MINYITKIKKALKRAEKEKTMSVKTVPGALDILNQKLGGNAGDIPASSTKEYALEKIYRTLGGEEKLEGVNTTSEIIEKIAGVAQGGGGGSSDFSTAEVTVNNITMPSSMNYGEILHLCAKAEEETDFPACSMTRPISQENMGHPITVVLYKGNQFIYNTWQEGKIKNLTGSAYVSESVGGLVITGDCSFDVDYTV